MLRDGRCRRYCGCRGCLDWDPCSETLTTERDRILTMDAKLRERVIGQEEAIK
jgi:hypothetical protein